MYLYTQEGTNTVNWKEKPMCYFVVTLHGYCWIKSQKANGLHTNNNFVSLHTIFAFFEVSSSNNLEMVPKLSSSILKIQYILRILDD